MSTLNTLLEYQEADKKLLEIEKEVSSSEEYKKYAQARKFMKSAQERLEAYDRRAAELKLLCEELAARSGEITEAIAEYHDLDEMIEDGGDTSYYEKTVRSLSDKLRGLKSELNKLVAEIKSVNEEYKKFREQTIAMKNQGTEYKQKYDAVLGGRAAEVSEIKKTLEELAGNVPADIMQKYAAKRKEKIFPIIVPLVDGRCICRMDISLARQSELSGGKVIECEHCRRFIYKK